MASHGMVCDLFNDRYLELQDVLGNVEPLPTLVPYEKYKHTVIVYQMDSPQEVFMALIQEFTERRAFETGNELWTWWVQWEVDETAPRPSVAPPHSPKKARLDRRERDTPTDAQLRRNAHKLTAERRIIYPELMREEDMMRILIDIVQVESKLVPNFIEFLYRWVDFYEGDGKALKAALHGEIPSLWDFEYHPQMPTEEVKINQANAVGGEIPTPRDTNAEELAQSSPTKKMREKPDLVALERQSEASERLQYREVQYGMQPPKLDDPLPPLINIPRNPKKRSKYYAACWKSRQRALFILDRAGITKQQIKNYIKLQKEHPKFTAQEGDGGGLDNYEKDAAAAQIYLAEKNRQIQLRNKQAEIAISNKLALEAHLAAHSTAPVGSSGVPLIPPTPSYTRRPDMAREMARYIQLGRSPNVQEHINMVPTPLAGKMKSKLFEVAKDRQTLIAALQKHTGLSGARNPSRTDPSRPTNDGSACDRDMDSKSDSKSDDDDDDNSAGNRMRTSSANLRPISTATLPYPDLPPGQAPRAPTITISPPQGPNGQSQFQPPWGFGGQMNPLGPQGLPPPPRGFENQRPHTGSSSSVPPPPPPPQLPTSAQQSHHTYQPLLPPGPQPPAQFPVAPGLSAPALPPTLEQRLLAMQQPRLNIFAASQALHGYGPSAQQNATPPDQGPNNHEGSTPLRSPMLPLPASSQHAPTTPTASPNPFLNPPRSGMQRNAPSPLNLNPPPPSPLTSLAPNLLATSPFLASGQPIPIQILLRQILVPANLIGAGGLKLGNLGGAETDALLMGHSQPGSGRIILTSAIFLPMGVWENTLGRVRKRKFRVVESYLGPQSPHYALGTKPQDTPHFAAYSKLEYAFNLMTSSDAREDDLTKRWRVSKGPMTAMDRGSVWEGWAATIDRPLTLERQEREGAMSLSDVINHAVERRQDGEKARRRRELEELMEEEEKALEAMETDY
ncbi:hypothetical protein BDW02DRAFT_487279 [Decorospora gaudefroyi]|uniref:Uncharacterized protein n=1 Tax=Decorospora gaudefroyi TaxID=184978 RepID=A0A6A5KWZ7_9PLEO|nr:hypothetical protein BDW02DRAFT_487279 [Decorospora gaudefroyi]